MGGGDGGFPFPGMQGIPGGKGGFPFPGMEGTFGGKGKSRGNVDYMQEWWEHPGISAAMQQAFVVQTWRPTTSPKLSWSKQGWRGFKFWREM